MTFAPENIPQELKDRPQWVNWKIELRDGKETKVPKQSNGWNADSTVPATWTDFDASQSALKGGSRFGGVGFVFDGDFTGIDFDNCVDPLTGEIIDDDVARWVRQLNSYTEYSPSGRGLHVIIKARKPGPRCSKTLNANGLKIEMYDVGRFFCMTGDVFNGSASGIESNQEAIDAVYYEVFGDGGSRGDAGEAIYLGTITRRLKNGDVIRKASKARNGDKFTRLFFDGDLSDYDGDDSAADLALCDLLHFWTQDPIQIDSIFRESQLMRPKWDEKRGALTYGERTVNAAIALGGDVYQGNEQPNEPEETEPKLPDRFFDKRRFVSKRLADAILADHHFLTFTDTEEIYVYCDDGIYRPGGEVVIREETQRLLDDRTTNGRIAEVEGYIRRSHYFNRETLTNLPELIPAANYIVDSRTTPVTRIDYTPHVPYISKIAAAHDPDATCPNFEKFLETTLDPGDKPLIQELFGDVLYRKYWLKEAVMFYAPGDNGKSVLLNVLNALLGEENISHRSLQDLDHDKFATADLFGKFANTYADIDAAALRHTGKFKLVTGGDPIPAQKKYCGTFNFKNYAVLMFSANELPRTRDMSEAFYDRWILMEFPYTFVDDPTLGTNERQKDPNILERLTTPEELSGILNFALEGLQRLRANNAFTRSKSSENIKQRWIAATDSLALFVASMVVSDPGAIVDKETFYDSYLEFCDENDVDPMEKGDVTAHLPKLIRTKLIRPWGEGRRPRVWKDISVSGITRRENVEAKQGTL